MGTKVLSERTLASVYARNALLNVLKTAPHQPIFQHGFSWFVRLVEHTLPAGLNSLREHFVQGIIKEAPALAQTPPPTPSQGLALDFKRVPLISQLIQEAVFQLLAVSTGKAGSDGGKHEDEVISGTCSNPRLALFLLDLFIDVTGTLADTKAKPLNEHLHHLRPYFFNPTLVGLLFEVIPCTSAKMRIPFLKLISSLIVFNDRGRQAGKSEDLIYFEPLRFTAIKKLMIRLHKVSTSGISEFLRSLIELNVSIEDHIIQAQQEKDEKQRQKEKELEKEKEVVANDNSSSEIKRERGDVKEKEIKSADNKTSKALAKSPQNADLSDLTGAELFWPICKYSNVKDNNGAIRFIGSNQGMGTFSDPIAKDYLSVTLSGPSPGTVSLSLFLSLYTHRHTPTNITQQHKPNLENSKDFLIHFFIMFYSDHIHMLPFTYSVCFVIGTKLSNFIGSAPKDHAIQGTESAKPWFAVHLGQWYFYALVHLIGIVRGY